MTRIHLRVSIAPGEIEVFCKLKSNDGNYERLTATVDTGAEVSLFPLSLFNDADSRLTERGKIVVDQAGIAGQAFEAIEAYVTILLEDATGGLTLPFEIRAWFADTNQPLIGFDGVLERAVLHVDTPQRSGWLEIDV